MQIHSSLTHSALYYVLMILMRVRGYVSLYRSVYLCLSFNKIMKYLQPRHYSPLSCLSQPMYLFDGTMAMDIVEKPSTSLKDKLTRFNHTHQTVNTYSGGERGAGCCWLSFFLTLYSML